MRVEIATALDRDIRVIPVLVQRAEMPLQRDLPDNLAKLARRNAIELSDLRWQNDVEQLIKVMDKVLAGREQARLAKAARDADAKRQNEAEEERHRIEEEKRRLLSEEEATWNAAEQAKRETEERERLALAEKRRVEEERQKAYEEQQHAVEKARREAEERTRVALAEKRRAEEDSQRQQAALGKKKIAPDSVGFTPNLISATNLSDSPSKSALADSPSLDEVNQTRIKRLIIIASIAFVAIIALVVSIVMLRPKKTNPVVIGGVTASPVPTLNPSPTPTPIPTPDYEAFTRSQTAIIKKRLVEGEAEVGIARRVLFGDLNADGVNDAVISYCANVPQDPSRNRYCDVTVFRAENGVLKFLDAFHYEAQDGKDQRLLSRLHQNLKIIGRVLTFLDDGTVEPSDKGWMSLTLDGDKLKKSK